MFNLRPILFDLFGGYAKRTDPSQRPTEAQFREGATILDNYQKVPQEIVDLFAANASDATVEVIMRSYEDNAQVGWVFAEGDNVSNDDLIFGADVGNPNTCFKANDIAYDATSIQIDGVDQRIPADFNSGDLMDVIQDRGRHTLRATGLDLTNFTTMTINAYFNNGFGNAAYILEEWRLEFGDYKYHWYGSGDPIGAHVAMENLGTTGVEIPETPSKGIWERFNDSLAYDYDENIADLIDNLVDNTLLPSTMLTKFFEHMETSIGTPLNLNSADNYRRKMIQLNNTITQIKGTERSWEVLFNIFGMDSTVVTLFDLNNTWDSDITLDDEIRTFDMGNCCAIYSLALTGTAPHDAELEAGINLINNYLKPINASVNSITYNGGDVTITT